MKTSPSGRTCEYRLYGSVERADIVLSDNENSLQQEVR